MKKVLADLSFLVQSPNISFSTLQQNFNVRAIQLNPQDPACYILHSRLALNDQVEQKKQKDPSTLHYAKTLWEASFRSEVLAALPYCPIFPVTEEYRTIVKEWAQEGVIVALASLAQTSVKYAKRLVELANLGDATAKSFAIQLFRERNCKAPAEIFDAIPLHWVLEVKKIDIVGMFKDQKARIPSWIGEVISKWDKPTRHRQALMLKETFSEELLQEILDPRTEALSLKNLKYLRNLSSLLPLLVEVSPSLQRFVRAYKVLLFQDPFRWEKKGTLNWLPCSFEDRLVLDNLGFTTSLHNFKITEWKELLPGQEEYLMVGTQNPQQGLNASLKKGFNPAGIALVLGMVKQKDYQTAIAVLQHTLQAGAHGTYPKFVNAIIGLVWAKEVPPQEAEAAISHLNYVPQKHRAVTPSELCYFFQKIHSPDTIDETFFEIVTKIQFYLPETSWFFLLDDMNKLMSENLKNHMRLAGISQPKSIMESYISKS